MFHNFNGKVGVAGKADYVVFATDYENYGAVYTCQRILFGHRRSASILSRRPVLDQIYVNKVSAEPARDVALLLINAFAIFPRCAPNWKALGLTLTTSAL